MVRVCYMLDAPFLGGAERYVSRVAMALDRSRFAPAVVMRRPDRAGTGLDEWRRELEASAVPVSQVPMALPERPWTAGGIRRALESFSPELVHINMPGPYTAQTGLLAVVARRSGAKAVVVTEHLPMVSRLWKRAPIRRFAFRSVDLVLTVSHANVEYLEKEHRVDPRRIRVIHNGLRSDYALNAGPEDAVRAEAGLPAGVPVIVFLGNLLRHKGLHRVIAALADCTACPWHLAVIGTGPEEARCRARADRLGVGERVTFLGARSPGDVERILPACDILALPSTVEGLPYVILEAMAASLAVVATGVYGIPEMVTDGESGLLVPPGDPGALAAAFASLLADPSRVAAMGRAGRARFEAEFTLERQVRAHQRIYDEVLRR